MNVDLLIVSCAKDFRYLHYALGSIHKFARGFKNIVLLVPDKDFDVAVDLVRRDAEEVTVRSGPEWPGKGFIWHMHEVMRAPDHCPGADFILHMDSDCIFTEPVTPQDYFVNGKPVLCYADFEWLCKQQHNIRNWQVAAENALGFPCPIEAMRRHPAVHPRGLYPHTQALIEAHTKQSMADYIRSGRNEFPQFVAEFPTLGAVAWRDFHDVYHWINQETDGLPTNKMRQFWSHREPIAEEVEIIKSLGL